MSGNNDRREDGSLLTRKRSKTRRPSRFKVLLHNDDFTSMEFVVAVLQQIFHMEGGRATQVMLQVHNTGIGVAGIYPHSIAETKVTQVLSAARRSEHPLQCSMEPE
ncbi:MAG: ATP-dependent Clp protease adapter ClpS [Deltaproteobacteria bacterium]|nr:ATP-dependent Clp protease adapter ClpS [Deltaproteobacteria bacterium]